MQVEDLEAKLWACVRNVSSVCLFWARVWLLVGDIYLGFLSLLPPEGFEVVKIEEQALNPLETPSDIEEKSESLKGEVQGPQ